MGIFNTFKYSDGLGTVTQTKYGNQSKLAYSSAPLVATAIQNDTVYQNINGTQVPVVRPLVTLSWTSPSGDFLGIRVIRNQDGFSEDQEDGYIIFEDFVSPKSVSTYLEDQNYTYPLIPGKYAYYSVWLMLPDLSWYLSSYDAIVIPESHSIKSPEGIELISSEKKFMGLVPRVYTSGAANTIDEVNESTDLYKFLSAFSYTLDEIETFADLLTGAFTGNDINPNFISVLSQQLGLPILPGLNLKTQKKLIRQAAYMYQHKGTLLGFKSFVYAMTGYPTTINLSPNVLLSAQDSSFYRTTGNWVAGTGATVTADSIYGTVQTETYSIDKAWCGKVVTTASNATISLGNDSPVFKGVPVVAETVYSLAHYVVATTTGKTVTPTVTWYDYKGTLISTTAGTATSVTTSWAKLNSYHTAPTGAAFAGVTLTFSAAGTFYVDMIQLAIATNDLTYSWTGTANASTSTAVSKNTAVTTRTNLVTNPSFEASSGTVTVRTNLVTNPSFEVDVTNWNSYTATSYVRSTAQSFSGTASSLVTANGTNIAGVYNGISPSLMPVTAGQPYTWSIYVRDVNTALQYTAGINWQTSAFANISDSTGTATTVTSSGWTRVTVTGTAPVNATYAQPWCRTATAPASGTQVYFDAALFEQSSVLGSYFDGSTSASGDFSYAWSGTANASTSLQTAPAVTSWGSINAKNPIAKISSSLQTGTYAGLVTTNGAGLGTGYSGIWPGNSPAFTVTSGQTYTWSAYVKDINTASSFATQIEWYDASNAYISNTNGIATAVTTSGFTRISVTGVAPATAAKANPTIYTNQVVSSGKQYIVDAVLFEQSSTVNPYFDGSTTNVLVSNALHEARAVETYMAPPKVNYLENPSFANVSDVDDGTDWAVSGYTGSLDYSPTTTVPGIVDGSHMLRLTTSSSTAFSMTSDSDSISSGSFYTFSVYIKTASGTAALSLALTSKDSTSNTILNTASYTPSPVVGTTWTRYQVSLFVPPYSGTLYLQAKVYMATAATAELYFDAAQIEAGYRATDFFDGDYSNRGAMWTGEANDSVSIAYPAKLQKLGNLKNNISAFLPINTPYLLTTGYGSSTVVEGSGYSL